MICAGFAERHGDDCTQQIDAKLRARNTAALERIAVSLEAIDRHLYSVVDSPTFLERIARAVEHSQGLDLDPPWSE